MHDDEDHFDGCGHEKGTMKCDDDDE